MFVKIKASGQLWSSKDVIWSGEMPNASMLGVGSCIVTASDDNYMVYSVMMTGVEIVGSECCHVFFVKPIKADI